MRLKQASKLPAIILLSFSFLLKAEIPTKIKNAVTGFSKPTTLEYTQFDVNNIACWFGNNGEIVSYNDTRNSGLEWPKGSGKHALFQSGLWLAGKVNGDIRTACSEYCSEFQPGKVQYTNSDTCGIPVIASDPLFQIYSINKGNKSDPDSENYNWEYVNWPVDDGAPAHDGEFFTDINGNEQYDTGEEFEDFNLNGNYDAPDGQIEEGQDPPFFLGDQTHWSVFNDFSQNRHDNLFKTAPLGVEVQQTLFGFDDNNPLKNVMFVKWLIVNKSGNDIDSVYFGIWSDPDLGNASDDYVGGDSLLNLGYVYNGRQYDSVYDYNVPSAGYCLLQGPIVPSPGGSALVSGNELLDFQNLPMTSFFRILKSTPDWGDPRNAYEAYNILSGRTSGAGLPCLNPITGETTTYLVCGNPVTGQGWIESYDSRPDDRRFLMSSGPFDLETWKDINNDGTPQPGEPGVQEIVIAVIVAAGTDHLNSIDIVKYHSQYAQTLYDNQFSIPEPPAPEVSLSELDRQIILSWLENAEDIENYLHLGYNFEGYNIYQGKSPDGPWQLIKTFDLLNATGVIIDKQFDMDKNTLSEYPVQFGNNSGIHRFIDIRHDSLDSNTELVNNKQYYFAVTSYAYNQDRFPRAIESPKIVIPARPHEPTMGQDITVETNDEIEVIHTEGRSEVQITVNVVDPLKLTGDTYAVRFDFDSTANQGSWYMGRIASTTNEMTDTLVNKTTVLNTKTEMIDGVQLTIKDISFQTPKDIYDWKQTVNIVETSIDTVDYPAVSPGAVDSLAIVDGDTMHIDEILNVPYYETHWGMRRSGKYDHLWEHITINNKDYLQVYFIHDNDVIIQGDARHIGGKSSMASSAGTGGGITDPVLMQSDIELRFTERGQNAIIWLWPDYQPADTLIHVPFEIWDIERNVQLCAVISDNNLTGGISEPDKNTLDDDWVIVLFSDYADSGDVIQPLMDNPNSAWLFYFSRESKYSVGDVVRLYLLNPVNPDIEEFTFTTPAVNTSLSKSELKKQLKQINVFPNPYFGYNQEETESGQHFVTFTHLPENDAVIRIFSLGGQLIRKIKHDNGTPFEYWDLKNRYGKYVASGMYIAHIDVKGVGEKILKIALLVPG